MLSKEEFGRLARLINDLNICTGIKCALLNAQGKEVHTGSYRTAFCHTVMANHADRCYACDRKAVSTVMETHRPYRYICHAGLHEVAIPVLEQGELIAIILFGQILDDTPLETQWERVRQKCSWQTDMEGLHQAFLKLNRVSEAQMDACAEIARTCVSEVRLRTLSDLHGMDDATRLRQYIETHYAEPLDAETLACALHVGKTKLYSLCQERYNMTPIQLLASVRIRSAMELLRTTRESIDAIGRAVGYGDQNYFTKVFRKATGTTPLAYRKKHQ